jgi:hypothetical protein
MRAGATLGRPKVGARAPGRAESTPAPSPISSSPGRGDRLEVAERPGMNRVAQPAHRGARPLLLSMRSSRVALAGGIGKCALPHRVQRSTGDPCGVERAGDDLVTLLADITIESDGDTLDPAAWDDWVRCVGKVKVRAGDKP